MNPRHTDAARDFAATAHILALARGSVSEARRLAYETGNSRVVDVFERAEPGSLGGTSPQWGEELGGYRQSAEGFIASLRNDGAFDAVLPYTARLPFRTNLAVSVTAITATETTEADEKPVFDLAFTATELEPRKASATVVISTELARMGGDNANALILRELRNAVIAGTDSVATAALTAATSPILSSGNVLTDLAALLAVVPSGASSRLFFRDRAFASKDSCDASRRERRGLPTAERQWRIGDKPAPLKAKRPRRLLLVKPPPKR